MPANSPYAELMGFSSTKANVTGVIAYTGAEIAALSATAIDGQVVYCYSTGSGFFQGIWYGWNDIVGTWDALNGPPSAYDFMIGNSQSGVIDKRYGGKEQWFWDDSNTTGADVLTVNASTQIQTQLITGTNTAGWAAIQTGGPRIDFSKPAQFQVIFTTPAAVTGQIVKIGMGIERAGSGSNNHRCFGIEYCDGSANWQIHSGNGSANNNFDTLIPVTAATRYGFKVEFNPGVSVVVTFDDGTVKTKTTNIPTSGNNDENVLVNISIANNNGSATSRTLAHMGFLGVYSISDVDWVG